MSLDLDAFLQQLDNEPYHWVIKRLSGNDTGLTGGHQSGVYLPRQFIVAAFPEVNIREQFNPSLTIPECHLPGHRITIPKLRVIYYNSKYHPRKGLRKKYDEFRITRWGGIDAPVQDKENTGAIFLFAVLRTREQLFCCCWIARDQDEEARFEQWLGEEIEPGQFYYSDEQPFAAEDSLLRGIPAGWLEKFPTGADLFEYALRSCPSIKPGMTVDELLLNRREYEYRLYQAIENSYLQQRVSEGFTTVTGFLACANSVTNRRKSRSGKSLEFNLSRIFTDAGLRFETNQYTEHKKKPDFLFPSGSDYREPSFPESKLHMLAAKTCCKDRWRQVLSEADRIAEKHLFTLQQGVSENQLSEMFGNQVVLVVPEPNRHFFPKRCQTAIMNLTGFVSLIRSGQD